MKKRSQIFIFLCAAVARWFILILSESRPTGEVTGSVEHGDYETAIDFSELNYFCTKFDNWFNLRYGTIVSTGKTGKNPAV